MNNLLMSYKNSLCLNIRSLVYVCVLQRFSLNWWLSPNSHSVSIHIFFLLLQFYVKMYSESDTPQHLHNCHTAPSPHWSYCGDLWTGLHGSALAPPFNSKHSILRNPLKPWIRSCHFSTRNLQKPSFY